MKICGGWSQVAEGSTVEVYRKPEVDLGAVSRNLAAVFIKTI